MGPDEFLASSQPPLPQQQQPQPTPSQDADDVFGHHRFHEQDDASVTEADVPLFYVPLSGNICLDLPPSTLVDPRSRYHGFTPPAPPARERTALDALMEAVTQTKGEIAQEDFIEFDLDHFVFYVNSKLYPCEMRPLHHFATKMAHDRFYFDGIVSMGSLRFYLTKVEVVELPIGNYGTSEHTVGDDIWVRSKRNAKREVYYRFRRPAPEYVRFHEPFLWVADLAKHVVDFCSWVLARQREVSITLFKQQFIRWLSKVHKSSKLFQEWRQKHPSEDFRSSIMANIEFIWKEMNGVLDARKLRSLRLFKETMDFSYWRPEVPPIITHIQEGRFQEPATIVTPYIMECFGHMILGKMLKIGGQEANGLPVDLGNSLQCQKVIVQPPTPVRPRSKSRGNLSTTTFLHKAIVDLIKVGDTISTPRDQEDATDTKWKSMASKDAVEDDRWFGLVQKIHVSPKDGSKSFDVTWFYRPVETPCCMMKYPWPNELFISDHCTCEDGSYARVKGSDILATHAVNWFGDPNTTSQGDLFVRQRYVVEKRRWVTLERSHLRCSHESSRLGFKVGETVLACVSSDSEGFSEAYEVCKIFKQEATRFVRLRNLLRRREVDPQAKDAPPNELVYTDQLVVVKPDKIVGKCFVRFFDQDAQIPVPYNRDGTGNLFYITNRLETSADGSSRCVPLAGNFPQTLRQGFDPEQPIPKLRGLDLFCGSGNFGRGLEDGGAVGMLWANDIWDRAVHTYMANAANPDIAHPFLGSVDDLLQLAMEGKYAENVPRPGDVDFISGGSPCPGFSLLTADKTTLRQIKNQSLVASFASFVDFYRPKYGVLENVITIVQSDRNRKQDVLSQLFCALVGLGYQVQLIMGDAWSYGAPQSRSRVFLYFAAPGLSLPEAPLPSHSHFPKARDYGLGKMCNGEPFLNRLFPPTPFKYVSAAESTADLPSIYDGAPDTCIPFPDHRLARGITYRSRHQFALIPTHPSGLGFATAWNQGRGVLTPGERELFPAEGERVTPIATGWCRVRPEGVFPTVTTACNPTDARLSAGLHWFETRPISIQEVRRAQGFPGEEVLLGNVAQQWKLVGNSVARQVAVALGLQFREAWMGSLYEGGGRGVGDIREGSGSGSGVATPVGESSTEGGSLRVLSRSVDPTGTGQEGGEETPITVLSTEEEAADVVGGGGLLVGSKLSRSITVGGDGLPRKMLRREVEGEHEEAEAEAEAEADLGSTDFDFAGEDLDTTVLPAGDGRMSYTMSEVGSEAGSASEAGSVTGVAPSEPGEPETFNGVTIVRL